MSLSILLLVITAAFIHASWNILLKRAHGGLSFLWCVDTLQTCIFVPWIGLGILLLTGRTRRKEHPHTRAAVIAGLLTGTSIATYTVWTNMP